MFGKMLTPVIVNILFIVGVVAIGAVLYWHLEDLPSYASDGDYLIPWLVALVTLLVFRLVCEWLVVQFRIYDVLTEIRDGMLRHRAAPSPDPAAQERKEPKIRAWARGEYSEDD